VGGEIPVTTSASLHGPRRRRAFGAVAAVAGTVGLMGVGGCGIQSSALRVVGSAPTLQAANDVTGSGGSGSNQYELYFFRNGKLTPLVQYTDQSLSQDYVLQMLIKGPSQTDQQAGYNSVIPSSLSVVTTTADGWEWDYEYSELLTTPEKAEIVCTIQADLGALSVGTYMKGYQVWNGCSDFTDAYGAPAILPSVDSDSASPSVDGDSGSSGSSGN
jgi:hypothetical protein